MYVVVIGQELVSLQVTTLSQVNTMSSKVTKEVSEFVSDSNFTDCVSVFPTLMRSKSSMISALVVQTNKCLCYSLMY